MAPRKQKPSKEEFQNLIRKHKIRFQGFAHPREWRQHQHYFQAIRNIASKGYDDYMQDTSIERWKRELYRSRVGNMRERALELLEDFDINEDTWRASFEDVVNKPFKKSPVCRRCGCETWVVDVGANPPDTDLQAALEEKRGLRKRCSCASERPSSRPKPSDESEAIFSFHAGGEISHCQGDDFGNLSIPMRPDRVIGLKCTAELKTYTLPAPSTLTSSPIRGRKILYPFLVVEAKKDDEAPGFRAIQQQTAFPVRRLLAIQDELKAAAGIKCEPSLVWFFAYRGNEWQLSAATKVDSKVRIYDLWDGKIHSQDGALRLLLIIDYIWSWARDIYRPSILGCLRSLKRHNSESTVWSPPPSQCSSSIPASFGDWAPINGPSLSSNAAVRFSGAGPNHEVMDGIEYQGSTLVEVADSHSFLKWAGGHPLSPPWTQVVSIRHSDIVSFKLRIVIFPLYRESLDKFLRSAYASLYEHSFFMTKQQLIQLGIIWNKSQLSENDINDKIRVTFLFQTYCNHLWEIERVLSCIVWTDLDLNAPDPGGRDITLAWPNFITLIEGMQRIRGKSSARCAMREVTLILSSSYERNVSLDTQANMQWASLQDVGMSSEAANELTDVRNLGALTIPEVRCLPEQQKRLLVRPHLEGELMDLFDCEDDPGNQEAMIAVRPTSWSTQCTKFCLFVFLEKRYDDKENLYELLQGALHQRSFADDDCDIDEADKTMLRKWCTAVKDD